ncbi:MAG: PqqD family protein [Prosthecobacter sp.]
MPPTSSPSPPADAGFSLHGVEWRGDGFGFDAARGDCFTANPAALLILRAMKENRTRAQILDAVVAEFDVTRTAAERDLEVFMAELARFGLADRGTA